LLLVIPLLLLAGMVAENRIRPTIKQFVTHDLVPEAKIDRFDRAIDSAYRRGDSIVADIVILVVIFGATSAIVWQTYTGLGTSAWYANGSSLTPAGLWYVYVSLPIFQFILLRWYYRLFIWARFLRDVSKLDLQLIPTHPDRIGGLGFLIVGTQALALFAMGHGALLTGYLATRVLIRGTPLTNFKGEAAVMVVFVLLITIAPLMTFFRPLILARRRGILEYGALASHYVYQFDRKWFSGPTHEEPLVGSADIQSLADMGGSYDLVQNMRSLPITPQLIMVFAIATLLPSAPLILTIMPLSEILKKLVGILF
jgi:hypothetical protein